MNAERNQDNLTISAAAEISRKTITGSTDENSADYVRSPAKQENSIKIVKKEKKAKIS